MSSLGHHSVRGSGFTLPELIIGMVITMILTLAVVGTITVMLGQYATGDVRQKQTASVQTALTRISDDIRQSHVVLVQNVESDANAPTTPGKWMTGANQLVLGKTPHDASNNGLYDLAEFFSGKADSVVYYLKNGTLYRRVVPANYAGNVTLPMVTCTSTPLGGCTGDIAILADVTQLDFSYFDVNNVVGATPADTESVKVTITTSRQQSGQTITTTDNVRTSIQTLENLVPPPPSGGGTPPPAAQSTPGLTIGPGGLEAEFSKIIGRNIYSKGRLVLKDQSDINISGYRLDVSNIGCGTRLTFPIACTGQQPIDATSFATKVVASPICAPGQTVMTHLTGYQAGCSLTTTNLPALNKTSFTASMSATVNSSINCSSGNNYTIGVNTRVNGNVTASFCNDLILSGNTYITGNLTISNNSEVRIANGVTSTPVIVVNGRVNIDFSEIKPNSAGVTPIIISFYSANTSGGNCPTSDSCVTIPNTELYDTINSSNDAIKISSYSTIKASLYAYFGTLRLDFGVTTGALAGQKVFIKNNSTVRLLEGVWPG